MLFLPLAFILTDMLKKLLLLFLVSFCVLQSTYSQITIKEKKIDSIYYRNNTKWILFTPLFLVKQEFSTNQGENWEKVGMLGGNVKPYLVSDSIAVQNINLYKYTRLAGIAQMWVIAPLLAYKHFTYKPQSEIDSDYSSVNINEDLYPREESGYLTASIIIFLTGTLTYHVLSKTFLYRSLHDFNHWILNNELVNSYKFNFILDQKTQVPQLSLVISF